MAWRVCGMLAVVLGVALWFLTAPSGPVADPTPAPPREPAAGEVPPAVRAEGTSPAPGEAPRPASAPAGRLPVAGRAVLADSARKHARIRILGPDGKPVGGGTVSIHFAGNSGALETEPLRGGGLLYPFDGPGGPIRVDVYGATDSEGCPLAAGNYGPFPVPGPDIVIRLPPERCISGRVLGPDGSGVSGSRIRATPSNPTLYPTLNVPKPRATDTSAGDGHFRLRGLGALTYRITVEHRPDLPQILAVIVGPEDSGELVLRYAAPVTARLGVTDPEGLPVRGARIRVLGGENFGRRAETHEAGTATVEALDRDHAYVLAVQPPDGEYRLGTVSRRPWTPKDEEIVLPRLETIEGRVVDAEGRPVEGAVISWARGRETGPMTRTDRDGRFGIGVPGGSAGPVRLGAWVTSPFRGRTLATEATVAVGSRDVLLRLPPDPGADANEGAELVVRVVNWPTRGRGRAMLLSQVTGEPVHARSTREPGVFQFPDLDPSATYDLHVVGVGDGLAALVRGVTIGAGEVHVKLEPGLTIRGRTLFPEGATRGLAGALRAGVGVGGVVDGEGHYEVRGLTPGEWEVHGSVFRGVHRWRGSVTDPAGSTVDVPVHPDVR